MRNKRRVVVFTSLLIMVLWLWWAWKRKRGQGEEGEEGATFLARLRGPLEYAHPALLAITRARFLVPPSTQPYNLTQDRRDYKAMMYNMHIHMDPGFLPLQRLLLKVFEGVKGGFFVEAGAMDGEFLSNSLALERRLGWTGLLVEADGDSYAQLLRRHRKAWSTHACLAPNPYAHSEILVKFFGRSSAKESLGQNLQMFVRGHGVLADFEGVSPGAKAGRVVGEGDMRVFERVQCLPLATLLLALNVTQVNLVSLDLEGAEEPVLNNFPWGKIAVDAWLVEHMPAAPPQTTATPAHTKDASHTTHHDTAPHGHGTDQAFVEQFRRRGYELYPPAGKGVKDNYLFIRRDADLYRRLAATGKDGEQRDGTEKIGSEGKITEERK